MHKGVKEEEGEGDGARLGLREIAKVVMHRHQLEQHTTYIKGNAQDEHGNNMMITKRYMTSMQNDKRRSNTTMMGMAYATNKGTKQNKMTKTQPQRKYHITSLEKARVEVTNVESCIRGVIEDSIFAFRFSNFPDEMHLSMYVYDANFKRF